MNTKFILSWSATESDLQEPLAIYSTGCDFVYSKEFKTLKAANEAYEKELSATSLQAFSELNFQPTDDELRKHGTTLDIIKVDIDEDGDEKVDCVENGEYYWVE